MTTAVVGRPHLATLAEKSGKNSGRIMGHQQEMEVAEGKKSQKNGRIPEDAARSVGSLDDRENMTEVGGDKLMKLAIRWSSARGADEALR